MRAMLLTLLLSGTMACAQTASIGGMGRVLRGAHAAAVVMDVASGAVTSYGAVEREAAPGSVLKPFVLKAALDAGVMSERATVECRGSLVVAGHNLACSHPRDITVMDARQALAESCNTYFAAVVRRMSRVTLLAGLRAYGLEPSGMGNAPDDRVLMALGVEGIRVSPRELAEAYRRLALEMGAEQRGTVEVVREGMVRSVESGMAHAAFVSGMTIGGKTGTAGEANNPRSHGWFAGIVFEGTSAARVIVVYVPDGNGNDAAGLARRILLAGGRGGR